MTPASEEVVFKAPVRVRDVGLTPSDGCVFRRRRRRRKMQCLCLLGMVSLLGAPRRVDAEANEMTVGLSGGVLFPAFSSASPTAFTLTSWSAGAEAQYGVTDNLWVRSAFNLSAFEGHATRTVASDGRDFSGDYRVAGTYYHPEVGLRCNVYGGYNLAPYVEASVGYLWGVYTQASIRPSAASQRVKLGDSAEGNFSASLGLAVDYRLFNTLLVGGAVRYAHVFGSAVSSHYLSIPLSISFYW